MKLLVITGATSQIGSSTALLASTRGYKIALGYYKNIDFVNLLADKINSSGGFAKPFFVDVSSESSINEFVLNINNSMGTPDALLNAAGGSPFRGSILSTSPAIFTETYLLNLFGTFTTLRACAKLMDFSVGGSGGSIINISSEATKYGGNNLASYAAAKAGVNILTISAAKELAAQGIRVNAVSPGIIKNDTDPFLDKNLEAQLLQSIPLGRFGKGSEVAEAIIWLLSDAASYITGSILQVNGGR